MVHHTMLISPCERKMYCHISKIFVAFFPKILYS